MACQHSRMEGGKCLDCDYCLHEVIYFGLCAVCGQSVDSSAETTNNDHIDINHKTTGIKVSKKEAERLEKEDEKRLLKEKKLSLIIDLDQTILHAAWEPHIAKWVDENKNDKRAKEMSTFSLDGSINKYTIKLRPGLRAFLTEISKYYEMHIYTMGTRAYADAVMRVIDPTGNLFHDRILSRDENGSMTKKKLERLFPSDQTKVIILDDRADVWDYSPNLIQMKPYEYFAGIGDINAPPNSDEIARQSNDASAETNETATTTEESSTSDKVNDASTETKNEELSTKDSNDSKDDEKTAVVANGDVKTDDDKVTPTPEPVNTINRPTNNHPYSSEYATNPSYTPKSHDPDTILPIIKNVLLKVHTQFFAQITQDSSAKPDVAHILPSMKSQILHSCCIVFSGVIPLQCRPEDSSIWKMATSFGATCLTELTGKVTHLVAATVGTSKVNTARKYNSIKIVSPSWLTNSAWEWKKQDEQEYLMALPREGSIASEVENPEESSLDFEDEKLDIDWDDSEVDAALEDDEEDDDEEEESKQEQKDQKDEMDDGEEEDFDDDWLAAELGDNDDDNDDEVEGYGEDDDDDGSGDDEVGNKRKRDSDDDDEDDDDDYRKR